jgi:hypothetical protein
MRMDAQEALTESDKNGDMEERVRGQMVELNPIDKEEATQKFMDMN